MRFDAFAMEKQALAESAKVRQLTEENKTLNERNQELEAQVTYLEGELAKKTTGE